MKKLLWIFGLFLLTICLPISTVEAKPDLVEAWQEGSGTSAVVKLKWKFATGDRLFRTFDGDNWTQITIPAANSEGFVEISDNHNGKGFVNGSNVFYEIRDVNYQDAWNGTKRATDAIQATLKTVNVFIGSGSVTADNAHGNYVKNTNTCASCHRSHKGQSKKNQLLTASSDRALCETCHTTGQVGSKYLVDTGVVKYGNVSVNSSAGPISHNITSAHSGKAKAPGDSLNPGKEWDMDSCITCHQAHPKDNNFRMLKSVNSTKDPITGKPFTAQVPVEAYAVNDGTGEKIRYKSGISQNCSQCHKVFDTTTNAEGPIDPKTGLPKNGTTIEDYDGESFFVHPVDKGMNMHGPALTTTLPIQNVQNIPSGNPNDPNDPYFIMNENDNNKKYTRTSVLTCVTCHTSHGTTVKGEQSSSFGNTPNSKSTMLKRMDNLGMCQDCHKQ